MANLGSLSEAKVLLGVSMTFIDLSCLSLLGHRKAFAVRGGVTFFLFSCSFSRLEHVRLKLLACVGLEA